MTDAQQHASPDTPRGARVRERMVQCALDLFGLQGFAATRTREIAQAADVNLAAIPYYFGTKSDLYFAAAQHLAQRVSAEQAPALTRLGNVTAAGADTPELVEAAIAFLRAQALLALDSNMPASWIQFFLRSQTEHPQAFDELYRRVVEPAHQALGTVIGRLMRRAEDDSEVRAVTLMLMHQLLSLRMAEVALLRRLQWDALTPPRVMSLTHTLTTMMRAQLLGLAPSLPIDPP